MSEPEDVHRAAPHHRPPRHAQPRARLVLGGGGLVAGEVVQLRLADPAANMSDGELASCVSARHLGWTRGEL